MTSFVQTDYPTEHSGVVRAEVFIETVSATWGNLKASHNTARSLSTLLLAGSIAALVLVADQLVDAWVDGHLFAAWVALWTLVFATIAVFAPVIKVFVDDSGHKVAAWRKQAAASRAEAAFFESAQKDPRLMAELRTAILRHEVTQAQSGSMEQPIDNPQLASKLMPYVSANFRHR